MLCYAMQLITQILPYFRDHNTGFISTSWKEISFKPEFLHSHNIKIPRLAVKRTHDRRNKKLSCKPHNRTEYVPQSPPTDIEILHAPNLWI